MSSCAVMDSILTEDGGLEEQVCCSEGDPGDESCRPAEPHVAAPGPISTGSEPESEPLRKLLVPLLPAPTAAGVSSPRAAMEQEKRIRREIANSNERRRMQSINAGFQTLRALLPQHEGEKLSKAAILQQTSDFIYSLEQERTRLLTQNCQLKRLLGQQQPDAESDAAPAADTSPTSARQDPCHDGAEPTAAALPAGDRSATSAAPPPSDAVVMHRELAELQARLEQERNRRLLTEQRLRLVDYTAPPYTPPSDGPPENKLPKLERPASPQPALVALQSAAPESAAPEQVLPPPPPAPEPLPQRPVYFGATTSRQNLDTIVEAIRHLEGDHLFQDLVSPPEPRLRPQEAPLELTTHARSSAALRTESYR